METELNMPFPILGAIGAAVAQGARFAVRPLIAWFGRKAATTAAGAAASAAAATGIRGLVKGIFGKVGSFILKSGVVMMFIDLGVAFVERIVGLLGIGLSLYSSGQSVFSLLKDVVDPASTFKSKLASILSDLLPSGGIEGAFTSIDTALSSATSGVFTPSLTLSGFLCAIGFTDAWDEILANMISSVTFLISVFFFRHSMRNQNFTFTKRLGN